MICPKCGNELIADATFCNHCGVNLSQFSIPTSPSPESGHSVPGQNNPQHGQVPLSYQVAPNIPQPIQSSQVQAQPAQQYAPIAVHPQPYRQEKQQEKWSKGIMALLIMSTICVPLVGMIAGGIGMTKKVKKKQGAWLLALGFFMAIFWPTLMIVGCTVGCAALSSDPDFQNSFRDAFLLFFYGGGVISSGISAVRNLNKAA